MPVDAIPTYEMVLKSNENLEEPLKLIRLSENETANVSCRLDDAGFKRESLSLMRNHHNEALAVGNTKSYKITSYRSSQGRINFLCSAERLDGKYQKREMRVAGRLKREMLDSETLCATNKCKNDGLCVAQKGDQQGKSEFCLCPAIFRGELCEYQQGAVRTSASANANYLYASILMLFIIALVFAVLFGREKFKRQKSREMKKLAAVKTVSDANENMSLQDYDICDGREMTTYADRTPEVHIEVPNEYDNVVTQASSKLQTNGRLAQPQFTDSRPRLKI